MVAHARSSHRFPGRLALGLAACLSAALPSCETGAGAADRAAPSPPQPPRPPAATPTTAEPVASTSVRSVRWPSPSDIDTRARAALDERARAAVDRAPVPVLVPPEGQWLGPATIMAADHWFAYAASRDGLTLSIRGTRLAHHHPGVAPVEGSRRVRDEPAFVSENRRIWTVSWLEHGVAYGLDVECASPTDARCTDETFAVTLTDTLTYVGGHDATVAGSNR